MKRRHGCDRLIKNENAESARRRLPVKREEKTMNCKYCGTELEEDVSVCPACGAAQEEIAQATAPEETAEATVQEVPEETAEAAVQEVPEPAEESAAEADEEPADVLAEDAKAAEEAAKAKKKKRSNGIMIGIIVVLLAVIAALIVQIVKARKPKEPELPAAEPTTQQAENPGAEASAEGEETTGGNGVSYTVTKEELTEDVRNKTVAVCGSEELANRQLAIYFWQQYYSFANEYGNYLSLLLDPSVGLDQQMYNEEQTWQQMFLDLAVERFSNVAAAIQEGKAAGYALPEAEQAYVDGLADSLEASATAYGYENADAYLEAAFGPGVTVADYQKFVADHYYASGYIDSLVEAESYTKDDISAFFDANAENYEMYGIQKLDKPNVTIRHILVMPEGQQDENGEYSEQAWADAEQKINEILAEYEAGEKTDDSFSELAKTYSADGNASSGGIYTDVYPGQMVETFNDWCFADGRKPGDYGLVKTQYGWHLIYFCAEGEQIQWYSVAEGDYLNDRALAIQDELMKKYSVVTTLENAAITDVLAAQAK